MDDVDDEVVAGARLIVALSELTEDQRHCVIGRHFRGLTVQQVADERRVTREAVYRADSRGMEQLRRKLDPTDFGIAA